MSAVQSKVRALLIFGAAVCFLAIALPLPPTGLRFTYNAFLVGVRRGAPAAALVYQPLAGATKLNHGVLSFQGHFLPPPPAPPATFFPARMRVTVAHQSSSGKPIAKMDFDLSVQSDGKILHQEFSVPQDVVIHAKERLVVSLTPVDASLPACILDLNASLQPKGSEMRDPVSAGSGAEPPSTDPSPFPRPGILLASLAISEDNAVQPRNREAFHFNLKSPGPHGFSWPIRNISVMGELFPITTGAPALPNRVEMIVRHRDTDGKLVSTDRNIIQIPAKGKIPAQNFPLLVGGAGVSEELEISFVPLDRAIPPGHLQVKFNITR